MIPRFCRSLRAHRGFFSSARNSEKPKTESSKNVVDLFNNAATYDLKNPDSDRWQSGPYPVRQKRRHFSDTTEKVRIDPDDTSVVLFPGQGTQYVGMGKQLEHFPNVKQLYERASDIVGYDVFKLCTTGPEERLNRTEYTQVCTVVTSLAALERIRSERNWAVEKCVAVAGFSVGEYAALVCARALSFEDAIRLVSIRGKAMQHASQLVSSGLLTVHLRPDAKLNYAMKEARDHCANKHDIKTPICIVANYLYPHVKVVGGHDEALDFLERFGSDFGIRRTKRLPVSGAFHTPLMKEAVPVLQKAIHECVVSMPCVQVISNVTANAYKSVEQIRKNLVTQICAPVLWEQTLHNVYTRPEGDNYPFTFECGRGSLVSVLKQVNAKAALKARTVES